MAEHSSREQSVVGLNVTAHFSLEKKVVSGVVLCCVAFCLLVCSSCIILLCVYITKYGST